MNVIGRSFVRLGNALYPMFVSLAIAGCSAAAPVDEVDPGPDAAVIPDATEQPPTADAPNVPIAGDLDPTFGTGGIRTLDVGHGYATALAADGDKLYVCATITSVPNQVARVFRFDADGTLDPSFGVSGQITFAYAGSNVVCKDLVVAGSKIAILYRVAVHDARVTFRQLDGGEVGSWLPASSAEHLTPKDGYVLAGTRSQTHILASHIASSSSWTPANSPLAGTLTRVWMEGDDPTKISGVGSVGDTPTWQVIATGNDNVMYPLGASARAAAGDPTPDVLLDAIKLPDGSVFAVGGVDYGEEVMAARFVKGVSAEVFVEHHAIGAAAAGRAVVLDGSDRPIVVGYGDEHGARRFAWQRYQAASATLDTSYGKDGIVIVAPPSGDGELVDTVRLGGKIYALGTYDYLSTEPKLALLRIVE